MTPAERRLLLMVAKDIRRLWSSNPLTFEVNPGFGMRKAREQDYDQVIHEVENGEEREASSPTGEKRS